ncbi:hypothetical protein [Anoxybacteroides tepidamans]|uniref:hypothetical protein n=1 Tax=Anoxybacteroides tepidamans TaxID=265948 RepID=UPI000481ABB3|nr:hypothetical protein [Anoxybacillus tepidamans]
MDNLMKQISNPSSTGGLGIHFENRVQASFVLLMLTGGFAPCLPTWPICKIKFQGKYQNFDIDDLIVYTKQLETTKEAKLLCQIKRSIDITSGSREFGEVMQAAWSDFNKKGLFTEGTDAIALITGPISAKDTRGVRDLLRQARNSESGEDFIRRVKLSKFSGEDQRDKIEVFRSHLKSANNHNDVTDEQLWRFLKSFHLLIYDLDIEGVTLSLLHSLIGQYSADRVQDIWARIVNLVEWKNENAGFVTIDCIPDDIRILFQKPIPRMIPNNFLAPAVFPAREKGWGRFEYASSLALANLVGSWNEKIEGDLKIISNLTGEMYHDWINKIQDIIHEPNAPIVLKNRVWNVTKRQELWEELGPRIFDRHLDNFKQYAVAVLAERHPKFELPPENRFAANIYNKVLKHSDSLRKGIAETLALLGTHADNLSNCSLGKAAAVAATVVREILQEADWVLWGSLNDLLPLLAEAAPDEFLEGVENALRQTPCPFDELFLQEGNGITGGNYMTGLLWALETLAWDEQFLVRTSVILGELASRDLGGTYANRPINSLTTIFLPWLPQTTASIEKRKVALQILQQEIPDIAWRLLLNLLPNQRTTSVGSHKPLWRKTIPENSENKVTRDEYWEQVSIYADFIVEMAKSDPSKWGELIEHLDHLPPFSFNKVLEYLSSKDIIDNISENDRTHIWTALVKFAQRHKAFSDKDWALSPDLVSQIENVAELLAPMNPIDLYHWLFNEQDFIIFRRKGQESDVEKQRQQAIKDVLEYGGIDAVYELVKKVESPLKVGKTLGSITGTEIDSLILPNVLDSDDLYLVQFVCGYVWQRQSKQGWAWVDKLDYTNWTHVQIGCFLSYLPFTIETWNRANALLGNHEIEYWSKVNVNPHQADDHLEMAVRKLIKYRRPLAAIDCLHYGGILKKQPLNQKLAIQALLEAISSTEPLYSTSRYEIIEMIKALQNDPETNKDDLCKVEWVYLPILDSRDEVPPRTLEEKLSLNPQFFCEIIALIYRSKKETNRNHIEPTEQQKSMALNAYRLLDMWRTPPGVKSDGSFSKEDFAWWLEHTKAACTESGHFEVAMQHVGKVLTYSPADPDGLWLHRTVAEALNSKEGEDLRKGFCMQLLNSRGVYWVDPTGKEERELAANYRHKADSIENAGYYRLAADLRKLAEFYEQEAERVVMEHQGEDL